MFNLQIGRLSGGPSSTSFSVVDCGGELKVGLARPGPVVPRAALARLVMAIQPTVSCLHEPVATAPKHGPRYAGPPLCRAGTGTVRLLEPVQTLEGLVEAERRGEAVASVDDMDREDIFYLHDDNQWPSDPPAFKETMREYRAELKKLAERVMEAMDDNLGLDKGRIKAAFTGDGLHAPFFGTKVSHYPPCPRPDLVTGLRAHTDAGGVILLFQDDKVGGLEVLKDGEWLDVQPLPDAIVVNTGDQIEVLSNGRYRSAWHRVLPMRNGNRRSVASFYNPAFEAAISPAAGVDGGAYPEYVFGDYMDVYNKHKFEAKEPRFEAVKAPKSA